jgi:hypothetical protein
MISKLGIAEYCDLSQIGHGSKPPPLGTPGPFSLSDENSLKNSFTISGSKALLSKG